MVVEASGVGSGFYDLKVGQVEQERARGIQP